MLACVPAIIRHVDAAAEGEHVVDHDDLLVVRGPGRVGAVEPELEAPGPHPVQQVERRRAARQCTQDTEVPLQHSDAQAGAASDKFRQERSEFLGQAFHRVIGIELDAGVELPTDEQDRVAGLQERSAQMRAK